MKCYEILVTRSTKTHNSRLAHEILCKFCTQRSRPATQLTTREFLQNSFWILKPGRSRLALHLAARDFHPATFCIQNTHSRGTPLTSRLANASQTLPVLFFLTVAPRDIMHGSRPTSHPSIFPFCVEQQHSNS
jgi:hypothetical protein